ncbi:MAG: vacuolar assembling protein VPS41 [Piptocephalis tieghemiana]|nr:MAG: vacuolar assembling protein VPS41 [Piptocephalis tieghemiana]
MAHLHSDIWDDGSDPTNTNTTPPQHQGAPHPNHQEPPLSPQSSSPLTHSPRSLSAHTDPSSPSPPDSPSIHSSTYASEDEDEDDDDEEEDEPKLKYHRPKGQALHAILKSDAASSLLATDRLLIIGTHWGMVHVMDLAGNEIKRWHSHGASVNAVSIDDAEEYIASGSDDGKVVVRALYSDTTTLLDYKRPIKCVQIDPAYAASASRRIASAGLAGTLMMNEKGWFGHQDHRICQGQGGIYAMAWRNRLIAWADDLGVKVYDTINERQITFIDRPPNSPRADLYRPRLSWRSDTVLLIGWADSVKIAIVKVGSSSSSRFALTHHSPIPSLRFTTDFIICGIAPYGESLLLLAFITEEKEVDEGTEDPGAQKRRVTTLPELRIIDSSTGDEIAGDALAIKGYEYYQPNDYSLAMSITQGDLYFILGAKDLVVARPRELPDRLSWLLDRRKLSMALDVALGAERNALKQGLPSPLRPEHAISVIGQAYLRELIGKEEFRQASSLCPTILGDSESLWEKWVFAFAEKNELKTIIPYIPTNQPKLSSTVYEMILAHFLNTDLKLFSETVKSWSRDLYDIKSVIVAVGAKADAASPEDLELLLDALAELHMANHHPELALEYYLRLHRSDAIDVIEKYKLYPSLQEEAVLFMEYNAYWVAQAKGKQECELGLVELRQGKAVQMLVHAVDAIPIPGVVHQLRPHPPLLHVYLDALFDLDPQLGYEYHDEQVPLYAQYDPHRLLDFLAASNDYDLERALSVCEKYDLVPEQVYILGRMGDNHKALMLIIERLGDVDRAIEFAKEQNDEDLWEDLLKYAMDKPAFIRGLLENAGPHIDPIKLIRRIPEGLTIPDLKNALLKIYHDCALELSLRQGCDRIMADDVVTSTNKLDRAQRHGTLCSPEDMACLICHGPLYVDPTMTSVLFLCKHSFHEGCLLSGEMPSQEVPPLMNGDVQSVQRKIDQSALIRAEMGSQGCPVCRAGGADGPAQGMSGLKAKDPEEMHRPGEEGGSAPQKWVWKAPSVSDLVPMVPLEL